MTSQWRWLRPIAVLTVRESWRSLAFWLVWLLALAVAGWMPRFDFIALQQQQVLIVDSLQALVLAASALLGVLLAVDLVGREVRGGAVALWLSRGASQTEWLAGRFLGLALALLPVALTLGLGVSWGSRVAADPFVRDLTASRAWWWAIMAGLGGGAVLAGGLRRLRPAPVVVGLTLALLLAFGWRWAAGWWSSEDLAWLAFIPRAWAGACLAAWVAACLAIRFDAATALWLSAGLWLVGVTADTLLPSATRWLTTALPSWTLFQASGGWVVSAMAWAYLLIYGAALLLVGGAGQLVLRERS